MNKTITIKNLTIEKSKIKSLEKITLGGARVSNKIMGNSFYIKIIKNKGKPETVKFDSEDEVDLALQIAQKEML